MNLDDVARFGKLDPSGMLGAIDGLPAQLQSAWTLGQHLPQPEGKGISQIVVAGMGGSAIGGDLLEAYVAGACPVPIVVWRDYDLPAFAAGPQTLVVACSHSGNTEETLSAFDRAVERGARRLVITTGGELARRAAAHKDPIWLFEHRGQPRSAIGFSFGLLLACVSRVGLVPDPAAELADAVTAMRDQQVSLQADSPVARNPAKRMAGQLMDRWPTIVGGGLLAPVARRWRTQLSEIAKAPAQFEALPESDHNMVAGVMYPEALIGRTMMVFLRSTLDHPRLDARVEATRHVMMVEGFNTDIIQAKGSTRLAQQWTSLHFGDYTAYYLAMAYGADPTPVSAIEGLKDRLKA